MRLNSLEPTAMAVPEQVLFHVLRPRFITPAIFPGAFRRNRRYNRARWRRGAGTARPAHRASGLEAAHHKDAEVRQALEPLSKMADEVARWSSGSSTSTRALAWPA